MKTETKQDTLWQYIYVSIAKRTFGKEDINELLRKSRRNNERRNITGILLYHGNSFFQVLEGREEQLEALYKTICVDPRHDHVTRLMVDEIPHRVFGHWSMGCEQITEEDLTRFPLLNDCLNPKNLINSLPPSRAKDLLEYFRTSQCSKS